VCARTGEPATTRIEVDAYRTPPWTYLFLVICLLPGLLIIMLVRNAYPHVELQLPVLEKYRTRRELYSGVAVLGVGGGLVAIVVGIFSNSLGVAGGGALGLAIGLISWLLASSTPGVRARVAKDETVVLKRVHPRFAELLEEIIEWDTCTRCGAYVLGMQFCADCGTPTNEG
jgi:hypothetical protein